MELRKFTEYAYSLASPNEFRRVLEENRADGIAAFVTAELSESRVVLPSNRAGLWFLLESQRLLRPVFRNFYRERDEAAAEATQPSRSGESRILEALSAAAFSAHPYRNPLLGWPGDAATLRMSDARQFFQRYYVPSNIVIAISGDVRPDEVRRLADRYFAPIPSRPEPPPVHPEEPPQTGPRSLSLESSSDSLLALGFKRPDRYDRDDPVLDVLHALLSGGTSSLLAKELVETKGIASAVRGFASHPGGRYPHLFTLLVTPAPGHTPEENERVVLEVLRRLQTTLVDEPALARARTQVRASLIRGLADNSSIAGTLAAYVSEHGDWRKLLADAAAAQKVTAQQVQLAAIKYFVPARRTSVLMIPAAKGATR
jgi:predicted Zn-dependent peptidase